ncbi:MAG: hydroxymethylglutaryl-CoA synthase, partial [Anaerolineae bacterium]|nr:hydroxymethylglutaryl-CoA synthase [Anaerolineae bacterium]MDW8072603.1 3-oxoacyl-[acyl-carrier-protein] synthase III C-terminal domain-containing protein [Anaerolineae bacterium]
VLSAAQTLMERTAHKAEDFRYLVLHQPNAKFPERAARRLGFRPEQWKTGLLAPEIGNTYAGAALLGLTAVLDEAQPDELILVVSFGSGAGSDAFILRTTAQLPARQRLAATTRAYIARRVEIDYALYARYRRKLLME